MGGTNLAKSLRHSLMPDNAYRPCSIINSDQSVPLLHCKRLLRGYPQPHLLYLHNTINTLHEIYPSEQSTDSTRPQSKKKMYAGKALTNCTWSTQTQDQCPIGFLRQTSNWMHVNIPRKNLISQRRFCTSIKKPAREKVRDQGEEWFQQTAA